MKLSTATHLALAAWMLAPDGKLPDAAHPDAETSCGPITVGRDRYLVWGVRDPTRGLDYYLGRFDARGRLRETLEVGWGYDGSAVCVLAANRTRVALVYAFVDPYGGNPELWISLVERGRVERHRVLSAPVSAWELEPVSLRGTRDGGWVLHYRYSANDDEPIHRVSLDRDGRRR